MVTSRLCRTPFRALIPLVGEMQQTGSGIEMKLSVVSGKAARV